MALIRATMSFLADKELELSYEVRCAVENVELVAEKPTCSSGFVVTALSVLE